jgi:hypothetical protein
LQIYSASRLIFNEILELEINLRFIMKYLQMKKI